MLSDVIRNDIEKEIIPEFRKELEELSGKTVLITGANGFLPSYLADTFALFNQGTKNPIKLVLMTRTPVSDSSRISHLLPDKNNIFIIQDVGKPFSIHQKVDVIFHAASKANPSAFMNASLDTIDANVNGTRTLLEYAKERPVESFIFFSSFEIYGNPVKEFIPTPEHYTGNVDCMNKWACYLESKRLSETLCMEFFRLYQVPVKIPRILLAYGPGMKSDGKVVSDFFVGALHHKKIAIRDRGEALRSFCYASDATRALLRVLFSGKTGEAYNVGNDAPPVSIFGLAQTIAKIAGNGTEVTINADAPKKQIYGEDVRYPEISKLRKLGFVPKIGLEEGLNRLKKHYEQTGEF